MLSFSAIALRPRAYSIPACAQGYLEGGVACRCDRRTHLRHGWPPCRPSTSCNPRKDGVGARNKSGHDDATAATQKQEARELAIPMISSAAGAGDEHGGDRRGR